MADRARTILLVDDEERFLKSIAARFELLGFETLKASCGKDALALAKNNAIDLAIVDLKMPDMDGLVTITKLKEINSEIKTVLLTGFGDEKTKQATEALNTDYFVKDQMQAFWDFIKRSGKSGNTIVIRPPAETSSPKGGGDPADGFMPGNIEILSAQKSAQDGLASSAADRGRDETDAVRHPRMIGETLAIQELRRNIERLAALDCTVIIRGETGTGKELTARMIHHLSPRRNKRFMAINCGSFSNDLLIEEFFTSGYPVFAEGNQKSEPIARPDAGGTILLDQIEELSQNMQLSMLKLIDSKETFPVDGSGSFPFDVRIMVSSRNKLAKLVAEGKFREELFHRLNILELFIPPLRERRDDIPPLCGYFLNQFAKDFKKRVTRISDEVFSIFRSYDFPGNVRELEHIIERAVIVADGKTIEPGHLPQRFQKPATSSPDPSRKFMTLAELEKHHILAVLEATGGNKSKAVELLGISRAALWRKLKQYGNEPS